MADLQARQSMPLRDRIAAFMSGGALLAGLWLWPFIGNVAAYAALALALPAAIIGWRNRDLMRVLSARWSWALLLGFALMAAAFILQPGQASLPSIGDFLIFGLAPLIVLGLAPLGRAGFSLTHLVVACLITAVLAACVGLYGMANGIGRVTAPSLSPIHFADLAIMFGFMGLGITLVRGSPWRWLAIAGPLLGLVAAIAAGTRAALIIGCALAALYSLFWLRKRRIPLWLKLLAPLAMGGAVVLALYLAHLAGQSRPFAALQAIWGTLSGDLGGDRSTGYRLEMYRAGWLAFLDSPLVGHGWHEQLAAAMPYLSEFGRAGYQAQAWSYIHSDPLSLAVAAGIPGLIAYWLFIAAPILAAVENHGRGDQVLRLYLALTFCVGLVVSGATDVLFMVEMPKVLLVLIAGTLFWLGAEQNDTHE